VRVFAPIVAAVLLGLLTMPAASDAQERVVNKQDADRIFGLNRSQWEAEVTRLVQSQGWKVQPGAGDTGTGVVALDPKTGVGLAVQPLFRNAQGPPETLVVGSYYPAGTFRRFSEQTRREMEAVASSDFGPAYSLSVSFNTWPHRRQDSMSWRSSSPAHGGNARRSTLTRHTQEIPCQSDSS
jgi:hypothetical protein